MNLHAMVAGVIATVNPQTTIQIYVSTGQVTNVDFSQTPQYTIVSILADVQGLDVESLRHVESLNIQGSSRRVWVNGQYEGLIRAAHRGGDLVKTEDGSTWLITAVPEGWDLSGWCSFIMTIQNGG